MLAHPGGPFFSHRDDGWWSLVKGLVKSGESDEDAARREFMEETGWPVPEGIWAPLGETQLKSRKIVVAWALSVLFKPVNESLAVLVGWLERQRHQQSAP